MAKQNLEDELNQFLHEAEGRLREQLAGVLHLHTIQWITVVMFAGVIAVGIWHGRVMQENNRIIKESIQIIKQNRGEK